MECPDICLEGSFLDSMLVLELFEGDFYVFSELALLALIDEKDLFDSEWGDFYFCL